MFLCFEISKSIMPIVEEIIDTELVECNDPMIMPPSDSRCVPGLSDSTREIRAMSMLALPCPPLPIMASKVELGESNSTSGDVVGNSHDLIAHLMNIRAVAEQESVNDKRMLAQVNLIFEAEIEKKLV